MTEHEERLSALSHGGRRWSRRAYLVRLAGGSGIALMLGACGAVAATPTPTVMPTMSMPMPMAMPPMNAATPARDVNTISINNFAFAPRAVSIPVGTTVTWTNKDDIVHTVTSRTKLFSSMALDTDQQFTFTFTMPGAYDYFCAIHPVMTGQIIVRG